LAIKRRRKRMREGKGEMAHQFLIYSFRGGQKRRGKGKGKGKERKRDKRVFFWGLRREDWGKDPKHNKRERRGKKEESLKKTEKKKGERRIKKTVIHLKWA